MGSKRFSFRHKAHKVLRIICVSVAAIFALFLLSFNFYQRKLGANKNISIRLHESEESDLWFTIFYEIDFTSISDQELQNAINRSLVFGHFDQKARYKMFSNVFTAKKYYELALEPTCIALQSTWDFLPKIHRYIKNWPGSVSMAIFAPSYLFYFAIVYIKHVRKCNPAILNQVSWHLAYPKLIPPPPHLFQLLRSNFSCGIKDEQIFSVLQSSIDLDSKSELETMLFPQNTMRNLARKHCKSQWVMCPDIDMVFPDHHYNPRSPSMYDRLGTFLASPAAQECEKCAFVFPLYEVDNLNDRVPEEKFVMLQYLKRRHAQINQTRSGNQGCSNLNAWERLPLKDAVGIAAKIDYTWPCEPVYVVQHGAPEFEERFIGYGMTRNTQVLEMHLDNYKFYLLDTIFLSHLWGSKTRNGSNSDESMSKKSQTSYNQQIFQMFHLRELALRYDNNNLSMVPSDKSLEKMHRIQIHVVFKGIEWKNETNALIEYLKDRPGTTGF